MDITDIYRAQADTILEFMESKGIKKEVLSLIDSPPLQSTARKPWSSRADHRAKVFALHAKGVNQSDIARMTGRSQAAISVLLKRNRAKGNI